MRVTQKIRIYPFGLPSVLKTDNMVRFGIIGTNNISDWFIAGAKMDPRFTISCVYSRTREKGTAFAAKLEAGFRRWNRGCLSGKRKNSFLSSDRGD